MTEPVRIRPARLVECAALEELQRRASLMNDNDRAMLLANPQLIHLPMSQIESGQVSVAEQAGHILGFSAVLLRADGDVELDGLFVEPGTWKNGVGRQLVEAVMTQAKGQGAKAVHVLANPHAAEFYDRVGFRRTGVQKLEHGEAITMQKRCDLR